MPDQKRQNLGDNPARVRRGNDERNDRYPYGGERDPAVNGEHGLGGERTPVEPVPDADRPHGSSYGDRDPAARDATGDRAGSPEDDRRSDARIREKVSERVADNH